MGQLGFLFVLPVLLQGGAQHLSAIQTGVWLLPSGVCIAIGAQIGGRLTRVVNTTIVVRIGLPIAVIGTLLSTQMLRHATDAIRSAALSAGVKSSAIDQLKASGVGFVPPPSLTHAIENAVASG